MIIDRPQRPHPEGSSPSSTIDIRNQDRRLIEVVVVGAGGHGRELADIVRAVGEQNHAISLLGVCDDGDPDRLTLARAGLRFLGKSSTISSRDAHIHLGIGMPFVRRNVDEALGHRKATPMVHPSATIGSAASLADGVVIAQNATVTTNVQLGRHTHINVGASVSHDCILGDYVTVCPQVAVTGSVRIGDDVFVGAGATILPGIEIGDGATIGAGSVVTRNVEPGQTVAGVPASQR